MCAQCHYSCDSCNAGGSNACTGCDSTAYRSLVSGNTCPCDLGFFDSGASMCVQCHYSCYSCTANSWNSCTSCNPATYRILVNNTCPCISGYVDPLVSVCLNPLYCDDNNTVSGDGCSSDHVI
jgi:hypothetical protein